jgi:glutamate/tyrosine decarboxylase-like PLP-dependent enzyme
VQPLKNFPAFHGTRRFNTVFTRALHWSLSWLSSYKQYLYSRADSVVWNPHKLLAAPQQCSVLLVRHPDIIKACHACNATYLFQKDKFYDVSFDFGDKYLQCGRKADVFKFWLMWKAKVTL